MSFLIHEVWKQGLNSQLLGRLLVLGAGRVTGVDFTLEVIPGLIS